ncbi:MAG: hypothetical protein IKZ09_10545, partial [Clostridia bacterium]|nr:hypothetical protein [Clostridia bacterium]
MTNPISAVRDRRGHIDVRRYRGITLIGAAGFAVFLVCNPRAAAAGAVSGLLLCAHAVIPSLFVFLVLSPLLADAIRHGVLTLCRGWGGERRACLTSAFFVGMLTGFPIGALTLLSLYRQGRLSCGETSRFLGVCTAASPAFLIGYFGQALWGSAVIGWGAWGMQSILCLIGFLYLLRGVSDDDGAVAAVSAEPTPCLSEALREAVSRMIQICGAVLFFSVLRSGLACLLGGETAAFLGGFAEMTGGLGDAAALYRTGRIGIVTAWGLSGALIGYGGFCVDMQIAAAAAEA